MSDKLSALMQQVSELKPAKSNDPDQRIIDALEKALAATTPERADCPWDKLEGESEPDGESGFWIPEAGS